MEWFQLKMPDIYNERFTLDALRLYDAFQKVLLYHLLNFLSCFTGERLLVLHFEVLAGEGGWVEHGAARMDGTPAGDFAVKNLAQDIEERQKLLNGADGAGGQKQVARVPVERFP